MIALVKKLQAIWRHMASSFLTSMPWAFSSQDSLSTISVECVAYVLALLLPPSLSWMAFCDFWHLYSIAWKWLTRKLCLKHPIILSSSLFVSLHKIALLAFLLHPKSNATYMKVKPVVLKVWSQSSTVSNTWESLEMQTHYKFREWDPEICFNKLSRILMKIIFESHWNWLVLFAC